MLALRVVREQHVPLRGFIGIAVEVRKIKGGDGGWVFDKRVVAPPRITLMLVICHRLGRGTDEERRSAEGRKIGQLVCILWVTISSLSRGEPVL